MFANVEILPMVGITCTTAHHSTQLNSSALLNGGTSAPLLAIYCWQQLNFQNNGWNKTGNCPKSR